MGLFNQYARPIQRLKASRVYKTDPQARKELDRLNDIAEADENLTKEAYLGVERRIIAASKMRQSEPES